MRHRVRGRRLGRNAAHRKAMFRNMACSLIRSMDPELFDKNKPKVPGRIVTTLPKAKELRPIVEKLISMACRAVKIEDEATEYDTDADPGSDAWREWRQSAQWNKWNQAIAPAVALRRRAFAFLRDPTAVDILFSELADRFESRPGGYTRVVRLPNRRLGDAGQQALIEFVGDERDRVRSARRAAPVVTDDEPEAAAAEVSEPEAAPSESSEPNDSPPAEADAADIAAESTEGTVQDQADADEETEENDESKEKE